MIRRLFGRGSTNPALTKFRYLIEGSGATLDFAAAETSPGYSNQRQHIRHVGTTHLITCVGVYFSLGANRCFIAHISAAIRRKKNSLTFPFINNSTIQSTAEANFFKEQTLLRLEDHADHYGWKPEQHRSEIKESLILSCPQMMGQTGEHIVEGIKEFLNVKEVVVHQKDGFIVKHPGGKPLMLSYDGGDWHKADAEMQKVGFQATSESKEDNFRIVLDNYPGEPAESFLL